jgi:hypothetical protein
LPSAAIISKEFDIPYICRRLLVNQLPFPRMLDIAGKKPWETKHLLDTMEMWKFGDIKNYTSLRLLSCRVRLPSPKDDMDGSDVAGCTGRNATSTGLPPIVKRTCWPPCNLFLKMKRQPFCAGSDQIVIVR